MSGTFCIESSKLLGEIAHSVIVLVRFDFVHAEIKSQAAFDEQSLEFLLGFDRHVQFLLIDPHRNNVLATRVRINQLSDEGLVLHRGLRQESQQSIGVACNVLRMTPRVGNAVKM